MWQHARFRTYCLPPVKLYSMLSARVHSPLALLQRPPRALRYLPALCLTLLASGCGGLNPASLWPFGSGPQGRDPGPPPNATAYRCDGNRSFYLRMLEGGAAWVILPEREFRLDKSAGAPARFGNGVAVLEVNGDMATLNDGPGQAYTGCRMPTAEAAKG